MSAMSLARQAFGREKPHSSITNWVDILTGPNVAEEAYDGIPELVESINLQSTGPPEASRALRKKLKHGNARQQYRALVILNALVGNCGPKFHATFVDNRLTDALKMLASEPSTDSKVKRKLLYILQAWQNQFADDPSMVTVARLYRQVRPYRNRGKELDDILKHAGLGAGLDDKQLENARKEKAAKEERQKEALKKRQRQRVQFNFEKEKPEILAAIANAAQAANNLVNAITLVNPETSSVQTNERVQDCLVKAKQSRKSIVRYIQLVENEELIGTLIEANERVMLAIATYENLLNPNGASALRETPEAISPVLSHEEVQQERQADDGDKGIDVWDKRGQGSSVSVHPDLRGLTFGSNDDSDDDHLPAPLQPTSEGEHPDNAWWQDRGSLSDYSDESSVGPSGEREPYSDGSSAGPSGGRKPYIAPSQPLPPKEADPFADPFA